MKRSCKALCFKNRISELLVTTEEMQNLGTGFQKKAKQVKERYWWRNFRCCVLILCILFVLITAIVMAVLLYEKVVPTPGGL